MKFDEAITSIHAGKMLPSKFADQGKQVSNEFYNAWASLKMITDNAAHLMDDLRKGTLKNAEFSADLVLGEMDKAQKNIAIIKAETENILKK